MQLKSAFVQVHDARGRWTGFRVRNMQVGEEEASSQPQQQQQQAQPQQPIDLQKYFIWALRFDSQFPHFKLKSHRFWLCRHASLAGFGDEMAALGLVRRSSCHQDIPYEAPSMQSRRSLKGVIDQFSDCDLVQKHTCFLRM